MISRQTTIIAPQKSAFRVCAALAFPLCFFTPFSAHAQLLTGFTSQNPVSVSPLPPQEGNPAIVSYEDFLTREKNPLPPADPDGAPVNLDADRMIHDDQNQVTTAAGNVVLTQAGRILRADKVSYDLKTDTVTAEGDVVLNEPNGDVHYGDKVVLSDEMKNGFVQTLKSYLADGSRFTSDAGQRVGGKKTVMEDGTYTPCEECKTDPDRPPAWQIRASEVVHDEEEQRISYKNARFEVLGVPVAYTPYFSHPDGTVKRKSGFLAPSGGFKSELGAFAWSRYYMDIAPDKDATVGVMAMTEEAPLLTGEWRQRWTDAALNVGGGVTYSRRNDRENGLEFRQDDKLRGHIQAEGLWNMNEKWRSGVKAEWASDDQYMRQYDFSDEDVLENEVYAERFSGRNYAAGRILTFQDIRVRENQEDQPQVLPEIVSRWVGEPGSMPVFGGRWSAEASMLGLQRDGSAQDMNRMSADLGWQRRLISDYGLVTTTSANARADFYSTRDRDVALPGSGRSSESFASRFFPQVHLKTAYPLTRDFETMQAVIEPIAALTVAPNIDVSDDIPNEDSQDVQIDASNIFEPGRFPGLDRVEDQSRVTYGVRTGLYGYGGSRGDIFLGQSFRLQEDDNPFPEGSGLDSQESDFVGQVSGVYGYDYGLDYRFQIGSQTFESQRHEIDTYGRWGDLSLNAGYLFAKALEGTAIDESREQLRAGAAYDVAEEWRLNAGATQDMGENPGLRKAYLGLDYLGQCYSWSVTGYRNNTDDVSGESDTEIIFRVGLKNLGEFEAAGVSLNDENE